MATKSVLSQSAQMQSSSAMALGSLMNNSKSRGSKSGASGVGGSKGPSAASSVLSQAVPAASETAKALGSVSASSSASQSRERADATKSVLSQANPMQSGSAMALGALVNKSGSSKRESGTSQKSDTDGSRSASGASTPARRPPEATKSVLSQAAPQSSAAAQALGARSNQRADATKSVLSLGQTSTSAAAQALGALSNQRANATKSVLSQGPATTSAAASALGSLSNPRARAAPVQAEPALDETDADTAGLPTRAEDQNRGYSASPPDSGFMPGMYNMPPLATDDDRQMRYQDALPHSIQVEHDAGSKRSSWMCCAGGNSGSEVDIIAKPRNVSTLSKHLVVGLPKPESKGPWRQLIHRSLTGAHLECTTCSKEIVQEISAI